jgi:hypothetical protein
VDGSDEAEVVKWESKVEVEELEEKSLQRDWAAERRASRGAFSDVPAITVIHASWNCSQDRSIGESFRIWNINLLITSWPGPESLVATYTLMKQIRVKPGANLALPVVMGQTSAVAIDPKQTPDAAKISRLTHWIWSLYR